MDSTKTKRALIWGFPVLILSIFLIVYWYIRFTEKSYQKARRALEGWVTLEEIRGCNDLITLDNLGNLWVGGCGGPYMFDGVNWTDTNYGKAYDDFEIDPKGQLWTITNITGEPIISVYNGQEWETYYVRDLISLDGDLRWIDVDNKGRPIAGAFIFNKDNKDELLIFENNSWKLSSKDEPFLPGWRAQRRDINTMPWNLEKISDGTVDKQNHLWIVNVCGDIGEHDGSSWTIYSGKTSDPGLNEEPSICADRGHYYEISIDNNERVWIWNYEEIVMFENGTWTILTPENTGIVGDYIEGLVVDDQDRVWILSDGGLSMTAVEGIQLLPQKLVDRWQLVMKSPDLKWFFVFIAIDLFLVWIMALLNLNVWQSVRSNSVDMPPVHKIKRLAKTSLFFGNLSFGLPCLILLFYLLDLNFIDQAFGDIQRVLGDYLRYLLILTLPLGCITSLIMTAITIKKIKKEGGDSDNMIKKAAKRGAFLGVLGIILLVLIGYFMFLIAIG